MSLHLKRLAAPRAWHIPKKAFVWAVKPRPGPHSSDESVPLGLVLRDYLKLCDRAVEAKRIIAQGDVLVDGRKARSMKQVVGFMDVVQVPKTEVQYRIFYDHHGRIILHPIDAKNVAWKLCRVEGKTTVAGGKTQINLHDGRNLIVKEANLYKTGDTLRVHVPEQKVQGHYPFAKGSVAIVTGGAHIGEVATVESIEVTRSPKPNLVTLKTESGHTFTTIKDYVFVIGKERAEIAVPTSGGAS